jgi:cytochrome P450
MYRPIPFMEGCRRRYGDIFSLRLGPRRNTVVVAEPTAARRVIRGDPSVFRAGDANGILKPVVGPASLLVLDGDEHMQHRRILLPAFGPSLPAFAEAVEEATRERIASWRAGETLSCSRKWSDLARGDLETRTGPGTRRPARAVSAPSFPDDETLLISPFTLLPYFRHELGGITPYARLQQVLDELDGHFLDAIVERQASSTEDAGDCLSLLCRDG